MKIPECMTRRPTPAEFNAALLRLHDSGALADASRPLAIANDHGELAPLFASHGPGTVAAMAFVMAAALLDATEREEVLRADVAALREVVAVGDDLLAEARAICGTEEGWSYELSEAIDSYRAARRAVTP